MIGIFKKYVNKRVELLKLELTETISSLVSILLFVFIILTLAMLFLFLSSIAIGFMIGKLLDNFGLGILIVSSVYLIAFVIFLLNYNRFQRYIMRKIIEFQLNNKDEEIDDED